VKVAKKQIKSIIKTVKGNATPQPSKNAVKKLAPLMKAQIVQKKIALGQAKQAAKNANLNKKIALKIVKKIQTILSLLQRLNRQ